MSIPLGLAYDVEEPHNPASAFTEIFPGQGGENVGFSASTTIIINEQVDDPPTLVIVYSRIVVSKGKKSPEVNPVPSV